jgi:hypothetical protein
MWGIEDRIGAGLGMVLTQEKWGSGRGVYGGGGGDSGARVCCSRSWKYFGKFFLKSFLKNIFGVEKIFRKKFCGRLAELFLLMVMGLIKYFGCGVKGVLKILS